MEEELGRLIRKKLPRDFSVCRVEGFYEHPQTRMQFSYQRGGSEEVRQMSNLADDSGSGKGASNDFILEVLGLIRKLLSVRTEGRRPRRGNFRMTIEQDSPALIEFDTLE
jgi:hypothetical protein